MLQKIFQQKKKSRIILKTETTASEEAKKAVKTGDDSTVELMAMMTGLSLLAGTVVLSKKYY